jgi:hypothetical protein
MYEKTLKETAGKQNLHYILPEAEKKLGCLQFPNLNHRTAACCAVWIMQVRHTKTNVHETVMRKTTWKDSFINTNLIHFLYKLHKIEFLYMFRTSSAHLQEVNDVNCTCMQPLVSSFSAGGRRPPTEKDDTNGCIHVQLTSLTSWGWADDARNM